MAGFIGFAPIYLNGLLAILFVFMVPGAFLVRFFQIPNLPQRWLAVFLSSLAANHFLVTLIAALHLDPLQTYHVAFAALFIFLVTATIKTRAALRPPPYRGASTASPSDIGWLLLSLVVLGCTYINVWKHGVPNIFEGGDVSISWNSWSLTWARGLFPTSSYGYPQFVPTIWAVTYVFTGSPEQYFAFYIYIIFITAPIALNAMNLGRIAWWQPLAPGFVLVWFIAEIQEPWLRSSLEQAYPDWVAAIFGFAGIVAFVANAPKGRLDRERITGALLSLCLVLIAAATKPLYALLAIAVGAAICSDAARYLQPGPRAKLVLAVGGLILVFVAAYVMDYAHLAVRSMPNYPVSDLSERLSRAIKLLNSNFTLAFRTLVFAGIALSPFLPRIRWIALPLVVGVWLWASTASYDLRNLLGLLMISAFIPVYAIARAFLTESNFLIQRQLRLTDRAVALGLAILLVGLTLPLASSDAGLKKRFTSDQLTRGSGQELNHAIEKFLSRGCTTISADTFIITIAAFEPFREQIHFFHSAEPLTDLLRSQLNSSADCICILYPPDRTHPSILGQIATTVEALGLRTVAEANGMVLVSTP